MPQPKHRLEDDLIHVLEGTRPHWEELRNGALFITGGTGFFGRWLVESFLRVNSELKLNATATLLTRDLQSVKNQASHWMDNSSLRFQVGDIRDFKFSEQKFSHIIHGAATSATATFHNEDPLIKFDTLVHGTRHLLDFAAQCGAKKVLLTSSGAVYGAQTLSHVSEECMNSPDSTKTQSVWGTSKRAAEFLGAYYGDKYGIEIKVARCFTFVGPHLPMDIHYAIGNFIQDGLRGGPIKVKGDGTPLRSYLYSSDLMIWLWTILFRGAPSRPYNVGSEEGVSIADLARLVAGCFPKAPKVEISETRDSHTEPERYVPSTKRAQKELGLSQTVPLREAIQRTIKFIQNDS